ncbi:hypothetical protein [Nocardiopsis sp. LOL_012]|uniref:hypothetical protein n=1 Tax=Nocardiopsis sp. LOL_012 TaxID=3345409 RepID=UPI003A851E27
MSISLTPQAGRVLIMVLVLVFAVFVQATGHDLATALLIAAAATGLAADTAHRTLRSGNSR